MFQDRGRRLRSAFLFIWLTNLPFGLGKILPFSPSLVGDLPRPAASNLEVVSLGAVPEV